MPARAMKYRATEIRIEKLQCLAWGDWPVDKISEYEAAFYGPLEGFLSGMSECKKTEHVRDSPSNPSGVSAKQMYLCLPSISGA